MSTYSLSDLWTEVGDKAGDDVAGLFHTLREAGATPDELSRALSMRITSQNLAAGATGEATAAAQLEVWGELADSIPISELAHSLDRERLAAAATTVLARIDPEDIVDTLAIAARGLHRLARSEAVAAAQQTFRRSMTRSRQVKGWVRELESGACELCQWWGRDGRVWPAEHTMPTHKGCTCAQRFVRVSTDEIGSVGESAYRASQQRESAGTLEQRRGMTEGQYSDRSTRGTNGTPAQT